MRLTVWFFTAILLLSMSVSTGITKPVGEDLYGPLKRFSQAMDMIERQYVRDVSRDELINGAIRGMLQDLDPHSTFMTADEFKEMRIGTSGEFSGIGIEISLRNGRLTVISPIEDTPAYKAGLKAGDTILEIDGETTQDITLIEAVRRIRGPKGSEIVLTILHKDATAPEKISINRDTIPIIGAKGEVLEDGYLYLRLTRFHEHTTQEMRQLINEYSSKHKLEGIVLDLRNNPGGLLDQAVSVADTFLSDGNVVYIQGRNPKNRKDFNARKSSKDITVPMVVLINAGSASASEIVAGALQDHNRALLIGERTFGKATVQSVIPLSDGSGIKLTTALYYTPSGRSIQAEGIVPDLIYPFEPPREKADTGLHMIREKDLQGHIENATHAEGAAAGGATEEALEMLSRDNQLRLALQLVKKLPDLKAIK
ncbi:S41 family peptidase [Desulfobaculum sp.]